MNTAPEQQKQQHYAEDEIDLFTLFENIWQQKILIALITLIFLIGGVAYAFLSTPVYKASTNLRPINAATLKPLSSLTLYSELISESPLHELISTLEDADFKQQFTSTTNNALKEKLYPGATLEMQLKAYSNRFKLVTSDTKKAQAHFPYKATFTASSGKIAADELNRLLETAAHNLTKEFQIRYKLAASNEISQITQRIILLEAKLAAERVAKIAQLQENHNLKLQQLNDQLAAHQQAYRTSLKDRIYSLEEAHSIAAALKISDPIALNQFAKKTTGRVEVVADISSQKDPLYLRGTRLLGKELEQLKSRADNYFPDETVRKLETEIALMQHNRRIEMLTARDSDHPFSEEIQTLKALMHTIQSEIFPEEFQLNFMSSKAISEPSPIKPKKALIVALSIILGGMLGLMAALIRGALLRRQESRVKNGA